MTVLRLILTVLFIPGFVLLVRGVGSRSRALRGIALLAGVGGAGLAINFPGFLDQSAREIGISSGADLTLYLVVLSLLTLSGYMVGKFRRLEQRLSRLVHELAVRDAESNRVTRTTDLRRES